MLWLHFVNQVWDQFWYERRCYGGGRAQIVPMDEINLHFTGDLHAITSAHNLLSAMIDNHIFWGNKLRFDTNTISWSRVVDMNDRSLRNTIIGLGENSVRENSYDITVASEVMAIFLPLK